MSSRPVRSGAVVFHRCHPAPGSVLSSAAPSRTGANAASVTNGGEDTDPTAIASANTGSYSDSLQNADGHADVDAATHSETHAEADESAFLLQGVQHREGLRGLVHLPQQVVQQGSGLRVQRIA